MNKKTILFGYIAMWFCVLGMIVTVFVQSDLFETLTSLPKWVPPQPVTYQDTTPQPTTVHLNVDQKIYTAGVDFPVGSYDIYIKADKGVLQYESASGGVDTYRAGTWFPYHYDKQWYLFESGDKLIITEGAFYELTLIP